MQRHTEKLRNLLASGLDRLEALEQLRDGGVSPMMCVKALLDLQALDIAEARTLVDQLKSGHQSTEVATHSLEASPTESVGRALAALADPPLNIEVVVDQGSWYSVVTAREANVLWRFVCERSVWRLEASPAWAPAESFDADLLAQHFLGHGLSDGPKSLTALMAITVADLVADLSVVRRSVVDGFRENTWREMRSQLLRRGRRRDLELFGRPLPPESAG